MMGTSAMAQAETAGTATKDVNRILGIVDQTEKWYKQHKLDEDIQNLTYYRGQFWHGDGITSKADTAYAAQRNEIFPLINTLVSSMAMSTPAVEAKDPRFWSAKTPLPHQDLTSSGKRIAAGMNHWAEDDELDRTVQEFVLYACLFGIGVIKNAWSPRLGRLTWRTRFPWEWHCDPGARRASDMTWCFERFVLHIDDLNARLEKDENGESTYLETTKVIRADTYPRSLIEEQASMLDEAKLKEDGLKEYVNLVEFWDFRARLIYHIHPESKQLLLKTPMPYGNPYEVLTFHDAVGRVRGLSDVSLVAANQRDINEAVSARREWTRRVVPKILMDRGLWRDEQDFENWKNAKGYEPTLFDAPPDGRSGDKILTTPAPPLGIDFNKDLADSIDAGRWTTGIADFQRGEAVNIRTAAEATMVRAATEGRLHIRINRLVRCVSSLFKKGLTIWKWAAENPDASGIDLEALARETQGDVDGSVLYNDLVEHTPKFSLLPFSPLMEDKYARRAQLVELLPTLVNPTIGTHINWPELVREIIDLYQIRPSILAQTPAPAPLASLPPAPGLAPEPAATPGLPAFP